MRRYDRELYKQIEDLEMCIALGCELGCGCMPTGAHDATYERIYGLYTDIAHSHGYKTAGDMCYDAQNKFEAAIGRRL